ncbi:MAG TPA: SCO1664 family protein [Anaerolineaceae bacterium]|nr:SCO1664 family protein [Anaerolineaceae bacterium]
MPISFDPTNVLQALQQGDLSVQGQFLRGSNYTFLAQLIYQGETYPVVYKPTQGEQPLWDFPTGTLAKREVIAYSISEALGWHLVPPTVYRLSGPLGPGSLQQYIEHDPNYHYFNFAEDERQRLRPVMLFDALVNNADRKGSHILVDAHDNLWLIDHGLCFHEEDKLRTVIWDFAGETIPLDLLEDVRRLIPRLVPDGDLAQQLKGTLNGAEIRALATRAKLLVERGCFPYPARDRRSTPWPPV